MEHKQPVSYSPVADKLLKKKTYDHAFDDAETKELGDYKPIGKLAKVHELVSAEDEGTEKEEQRKRLIREKLQKIDDVQKEAGKIQLDNYTEKFSENATKDTIVLAEIPLEELNEEAKKQAEQREARRLAEMLEHERSLGDLKILQEESKDELYHRGELLRKQLTRLEQESVERTLTKNMGMKHAFSKVGSTLKSYLNDTKQEVEVKYRDLSIAYKEDRHNLTNNRVKASASRLWQVQPQIVEVRVELVRCVKDKLPKGRYTILCSILDRIGGNPMEYGQGKSKKWRRITNPKTHSGEYYLNNLRFEKSLLIVGPPRAEVRPSMVYLFELFLLKSKEYAHDQVLGWGVFPLIDSEFELNKGKFKVHFAYDIPSNNFIDPSSIRTSGPYNGQIQRHRRSIQDQPRQLALQPVLLHHQKGHFGQSLQCSACSR